MTCRSGLRLSWLALAIAATGCFGPPGGPPDGGPPAPTPADSARSTVIADRTAGIVADGTDGVRVAVTLLTADGGALSNTPVRLDVTGSGNLAIPPQPTNGLGLTTFYVRSTVAELKTISATANPGPDEVTLAQQPQATFVAGPPGIASTLTPTPAAVPADGVTAMTLTAVVADSYGNVIPGQLVELSVNGTANTLSPTSGYSDANGAFTATLRSTKPELKTVTVKLGAFTFTGDVRFLAGPPSASNSSLSISPGTVVANGTAIATLTATFRDATGELDAAMPVTVVVTGTNNAVTPASGVTNNNGVFTATIASTKAQTKSVTATGGGLPLTGPLIFVPGPVSAGMSTLSANPTSIVAGGAASTVTVALKDAQGNPIPNAAVSLGSNGTGNSIAPPSGNTDAAGVWSTSFSSTVAQTKQLTATGPSYSQSIALTVSPGSPSQTGSTLNAVPGTVIADNASFTTVVMTVADANGNPISGVLVNLSVDGTSNTLTPTSAYTDGLGNVTATLRSSKAETKPITATSPGVSLQKQVAFVAGPPVLANSTLDFSSPTPVANGTPYSITVTVHDALGNPVASEPVDLAVTGTNNALSAANGATNSSGVFLATLSSTRAEPKTITATIAGSNLTRQVTFQPGPPSAVTSVFGATPPSAVVGSNVQLQVTVLDAQGNPISGLTAVFSSSNVNDLVTPPIAPITDSNGVATATLSSTRAEPKLASVSVGGLDLVVPVTFIPGPPSFTASTLTISAPSVAAGEGDTATLTTTVLDSYLNPVPSQLVALSASGSGNTFAPAASGLTNASGVYVATLASTAIGTKSVLATVDSFGLAGFVTFVLAPPRIVALLAPPSPVGGCVPISYSVRQAQQLPVDLVVEVVSGGTPRRATQAGSPTAAGISRVFADSAPGGTPHTFLWNSSRDFPLTSASGLTVRITPYLGRDAGVGMEVSPVDLNNTLSFGPAASASVMGADPRGIAAGDFDRDGKMDLAVANSTSHAVAVFLGNGDGTFQVAVPYATDLYPRALALGDFNRDGKLDLATFNWGSYDVSVLLGVGNGTFQPHVDTFLAVGREHFAVADLNRDGKLDVVAPGYAVALGNGDGTFGPVTTTTVGTAPSSIATADFDRDGRVDLATATNPAGNDIAVTFGNGDGTLGSTVLVTLAAPPVFVAAGDFNGDHKDDLLTASGKFVAGNGNGTFAAPVTAGFSVGSVNDLFVADFNRDSRLDVALVSSASGGMLVVQYGLGDGTFQVAASSALGGPYGRTTAADFDLDGRVDVAAINSSAHTVTVRLNSQPPRCDQQLMGREVLWTTWAYAGSSGDVNADGKPDLLTSGDTGSGTGFIQARLGLGNGSFRPGLMSCSAGWTRAGVLGADFNNDRIDDVVAGSQGQVAVCLSDGGSLYPAVNKPLAGLSVNDLAVADFNKDGRVDLAVGAAQGSVGVLLGNGNGTLADPTLTVLGSGVVAMATADLNGDGNADLVALNGTATILLGNGDGGFLAPQTHAMGAAPGRIRTADFNGDGKVDLAVASSSISEVSVALGLGNGAFQPRVAIAVSGVPEHLATADFTGDGVADLTISIPGQNSVELRPGNGNGTFGPAVFYSLNDSAMALVPADFNADGRPDLALTHGLSNATSVVISDGPTGFRGSFLVPDGFTQYWMLSEDFNRDGKADLAVAHANELRVLSGLGDGGFQPPITTPVSSYQTRMVTADFNRDGKMDVASIDGDGTTNVLYGNGDGTFPTTASSSAVPNATALAAIDCDRDGDPDLAVINSSTIYTLLMQPDAGLVAGPISSTLPYMSSLTSVATTDANHDGALDLVVTNPYSADSVGIFVGNGACNFARSASYSGIYPPYAITADLNRDGKADVIGAYATGSYTLGRMLGSGPGTLGPSVTFNSGGTHTPFVVSANDFDGDGRLDVVSSGQNYGSLAVWRGLGDGNFVSPLIYALGNSTGLMAVTDLNGDGLPDVIAPSAFGNLEVFLTR